MKRSIKIVTHRSNVSVRKQKNRKKEEQRENQQLTAEWKTANRAVKVFPIRTGKPLQQIVFLPRTEKVSQVSNKPPQKIGSRRK